MPSTFFLTFAIDTLCVLFFTHSLNSSFSAQSVFPDFPLVPDMLLWYFTHVLHQSDGLVFKCIAEALREEDSGRGGEDTPKEQIITPTCGLAEGWLICSASKEALTSAGKNKAVRFKGRGRERKKRQRWKWIRGTTSKSCLCFVLRSQQRAFGLLKCPFSVTLG